MLLIKKIFFFSSFFLFFTVSIVLMYFTKATKKTKNYLKLYRKDNKVHKKEDKSLTQ